MFIAVVVLLFVQMIFIAAVVWQSREFLTRILEDHSAEREAWQKIILPPENIPAADGRTEDKPIFTVEDLRKIKEDLGFTIDTESDSFEWSDLTHPAPPRLFEVTGPAEYVNTSGEDFE